MTDAHAFVFAPYGQLPLHRARTLRQFVEEVGSAPPASLIEYLRRRDFSRWIRGIFGDPSLAAELYRFEQRYGTTGPQAAAAIANAVRGRYDVTDTDWEREPGVHPPVGGEAELDCVH